LRNAKGGHVTQKVYQVLPQTSLRTRDLGGTAGTEACGRAIADAVR